MTTSNPQKTLSGLYGGAVALLMATHMAGLIGMQVAWSRPWFLLLTPLNLLLTAGLLIAFQPERNAAFVRFTALTVFVGFVAELIGVQTGWLFGAYAYGATLGPKLWGVPFVIGINWFVLVYSIGVWLSSYNWPRWRLVLVGSVLMVLLDVLIEPVAIRFDFWAWHEGAVPWRNYGGWFLVSVLLFGVFTGSAFRKQNPLARVVVAVQAAFFLGHALLAWV
ncbi:carotenoid biosynthesis protein [Catalinimonas alkaloidigena]|uniref:carotenoid biosynthesis protein n=1 Tax=Catalinimonas alkaloidigena TaxID=1075417 RepID=UPI001C40975B|nr:carotenoid biosynthesis protein [Catalinimonas alkaloidigena]